MSIKLNRPGIIMASVAFGLLSYPVMVFAESEITLESEKGVFEPTARIFLTGTVDPGDAFYEQVTIVVYDSNGKEIIQSQSDVKNNQFSALITGPLDSFEKGIYRIEASHVSATNRASIFIGIDDLIRSPSTLMHLTPLKQVEMGTEPAQVTCTDRHVLIQNNHTDSVACVKPSTAVVLEARGWGTLY